MSILYVHHLEDSPIGPIYIAVSRLGLRYIFLHKNGATLLQAAADTIGATLQAGTYFPVNALQQVTEYLGGTRKTFKLDLDLPPMSPFRKKVLGAAVEIPYGSTITYGELATRIGTPSAARAVGQALAHNPVPIVIPCHRVLAHDNGLRGYSAGRGIPTKAFLLKLEGVLGT
ncbi:MAG: methylated-DNA--[protein]-cysteine S-methyltransferase [Anaerolineales bacterium]|nr:methylated-DNA--[protein]-cysteine S-methyltransferase [Anaerolineales bacterium]